MCFTYTPTLPKYLDLELTNACPAKCLMCPREKLPSIGIMTDETFKNIINSLRENSLIRVIGLCGIGEPLLHPKLFEYIKEIKSLPQNPKISLVTSGEKLTPEIFEKLIKFGVNRIELSIQAIEKKLYEKLMPNLNFEKVMSNIDYISKRLSTGIDFCLSYTENKLNSSHTNEIVNFSRLKGLNISVRKIHSRGGNVENEEIIDITNYSNHKAKSCRIFELINFISWDGNIQICCQDVAREHIVGNINKDSFFDIAAKKMEIMYNQGLKYNICTKCTDPFRLTLN